MQSENNSSYMPSLFGSTQAAKSIDSRKNTIPQGTYYDMAATREHSTETKHVVVFGFSPGNRGAVLSKIRQVATVQRVEEGKNSLSVWCEEVGDLERLMKLTHSKINGEIVGVFRKNFGVVQSEDVYARKTGIFERIRLYLFGEQQN